MDGNRQVQLCPAALRDVRMLLPSAMSQAILLRHARKLRNWRSGDDRALDLDIARLPQSAIYELCIGDSLGFHCGIRRAFFEDALSGPDGCLWVIGSRREDELLSELMIDTLNHRREIIEENGEKD